MSETARPISAAEHLRPEFMEPAQRHLVAKAIAEFSHERILAPQATTAGDASESGAGEWSLTSPDSTQRWTFSAQRFALEHWVVDPASIARTVNGTEAPVDAQEFIAAFAPALGLPDALLATYLEEISSTLASAAYRRFRGNPSSSELVDADFQTIEHSMTEGHPGFVANNGRIGWSASEHDAYSPEAGRPIRLVWLAARREHTHLSLTRQLDEAGLYEFELGDAVYEHFDAVLRERGVNPDDYLLLPVHPWQWEHRISIGFAPDVAREDLIFLGEGPDRYQAQQSIRTFFNLDHPQRCYVKTALSIQNMGFLRGLSPAYMVRTPAINDWVYSIVAADSELQSSGFSVLREIAAIGYTGDAYHQIKVPGPAPAHQKMIAALWRESPVPRVADGERLATLASLLHRDEAGVSLAAEMIRASGVEPREWVRSLLDAYLRPVVHCLLAYGIAFMPHGENIILVIENNVPVRAIMKDIGEEVAVLTDRELPGEIERIRHIVPTQEQELVIHTDVFDGVLRHLAGMLDADGVLLQEQFWTEVHECIARHKSQFPQAHERLDLFRERFAHSCLNRLQLKNTLQMVDLTDQAASLLYAGELVNPIGPAGVGGSAENQTPTGAGVA